MKSSYKKLNQIIKIKIWEKQPGGFFESRNNGLVVNGGAMFPHDSGVIIIHPLYAANGPIRGQY